MIILQQANEADLLDEEYIHLYQTVHSLFYMELENNTQYTAEELSIEGV